MAIGEHEGEVVGLPSIISTPTLIYNADLFRAAGLDPDDPPSTWEDAKAAGQAIAEGEGIYVAVVDPAKSDYLTQSLIYSNGGELLTEDGEVAFDQPEAVDALAMAAWKFVKFLTSERGFTIVTSQIGYLPLRPAILDDPELLGDFLEEDPRILPTIEQLDSLHPYQDLPGPDADRARQILQDDAVEPIVLGGADPATTLAAAADRIRDLLP